jgi:hypothetical protein
MQLGSDLRTVPHAGKQRYLSIGGGGRFVELAGTWPGRIGRELSQIRVFWGPSGTGGNFIVLSWQRSG